LAGRFPRSPRNKHESTNPSVEDFRETRSINEPSLERSYWWNLWGLGGGQGGGGHGGEGGVGGKKMVWLGFHPNSPFYTRSGNPVESRRRRAVWQPAGWRPVSPGAVPDHPVRQPVRTGPVPESGSGKDSGAEPVQALGWPVHRPAAPDISRKNGSSTLLDDTKQ
jgi:hypothetical protein